MKKLVGILICLVAIFIILYIFLPSTGKIGITRNIKSSEQGIYRTLINNHLWNKWFGATVNLNKPLNNSAVIDIKIDDRYASGNVLLVPITNDSTKVFWETELSGYNRITDYFKLKELTRQLSFALDSLEQFSKSPKNVYGIDIKETTTKDTLLITKRFTTRTYPTQPEIYSNINDLKKDTAAFNVKQTGYPMLNITPSDSIWNCMVALPIDKKLNVPSFVRMIPGKFLTTEVKGGPHTIHNAYNMMQQYFSDYKRTSMAIPFEYIITDRLNEPDTSRWITYIYFPVY